VTRGTPVGSFLFGNDLPPVWVPLDGPVETLNALGLSESDLESICWRNAARFFHLSLAEKPI
jgi:predicted TIM-barrel fold metal-dependent hydrolase